MGRDPMQPLVACLGVGRCVYANENMTCSMCRELGDRDDIPAFVARLVKGH